MASGLYAIFMRRRRSPRRTFTTIGLKAGLHRERLPMDFIFIVVGVALFAAFAGYAALLRRI